MITLPLRIRYCPQPLRPAVAWLIPGQDCATWLAELLRWETPLAEVVIYVVPRSSTDLSPHGVLVVLPKGSLPKVSHRCQPYGRIGVCEKGASAATVYLPVEARFDPDAADAEITELLGSVENVHLWHPACGLVGFEPSDRRHIADLLVAPPERETAWDLARPGPSFSTRLTAIEPDRTSSAEFVLDVGKEDIGSQSGALDQLPRSPHEPPIGLLARMSATIKQKLTGLLHGAEQVHEASGGKAESSEAAAGEAADESTGVGDEATSQHPGKATSVIVVSGDSPGGIDPQSTGTEGVRRGLGGVFARLRGAAAGMARAASQGLAGLEHWLGQLGRRSRKREQPPGNVAGRPRRIFFRKDEKLLAKRHREIHRLLHALETDPDRGLRFALPLNQGRHRGIGRPGSKLVHRKTDFSLKRLYSSEPIDLWDLPYDLRQQVLAKYHELASRELRLGRFRRAAYIYAELLGNMELAASALTTGCHWREAAVLYRDQLHRPDAAARCLEQGGLWTEAIALYEELGEHEKAGDLYRQLDQLDRAQQAYRAAVAQHAGRDDCLEAARLLESKLDAPDEAVAQLSAGWPSSHQAGPCLQELFGLFARLGRHKAALAKIEKLREESLPPQQMLLLIDILSQTATAYPNDSVTGGAADATRTLAAARLRQASEEERPRLLEAVRRLVPADRLLGRDCQRFLRPPARPALSGSRSAAATRGTMPPPSRSFPVERKREIKLSPKVRWQAVASAGNVLYAAGYEDGRLVVDQVFWNGTKVRLEGGLWEGLPLDGRPILLAPDPRGRQPLVVCVVAGPPLPPQKFPVADASLGRVQAGTPSWIGPATIAAQRTGGGVTQVLQWRTDGLVLHFFNYQDQPLGSRHLPFSEILPAGLENGPPLAPIPFHARSDATYLALGNRLVVVKPIGGVELVDLPDTITALDGSLPFSRTQLVATMETGAVLCWDASAQRRASLATELARPVARFTTGGWLLIASAGSCQVYRTEGQRIRLEADGPGSEVRPLAVLDTADPNQFALFGMDGTIRIYQMRHR